MSCFTVTTNNDDGKDDTDNQKDPNEKLYVVVACIAALVLVAIIQASCTIFKMSRRGSSVQKVNQLKQHFSTYVQFKLCTYASQIAHLLLRIRQVSMICTSGGLFSTATREWFVSQTNSCPQPTHIFLPRKPGPGVIPIISNRLKT